MAYETKPGQGALFVNDKGDNDKRPDRRGDLVCPCCQASLKLSGWLKTSKAGAKYLSLSAQQDGASSAPQRAETPALPKDYDDDLPF